MTVSRNITRIINYVLDNLCPPILRDCYYLMYPIYWIAYGKHTEKLLRYKDSYPFLNDTEYEAFYKIAGKTSLSKRPTDLNREGVNYILNCIIEGESVLDAGCGRGFLAKEIGKRKAFVTGLDIERPADTTGYSFVEGHLEKMPFDNQSFDIVICAHVLEHVPDFRRCVSELLRVAKRKVIIVLPRQREYRYTADLHIRFFPYEYNIRSLLPESISDAQIRLLGGDWVIEIDKGMPKTQQND